MRARKARPAGLNFELCHLTFYVRPHRDYFHVNPDYTFTFRLFYLINEPLCKELSSARLRPARLGENNGMMGLKKFLIIEIDFFSLLSPLFYYSTIPWMLQTLAVIKTP